MKTDTSINRAEQQSQKEADTHILLVSLWKRSQEYPVGKGQAFKKWHWENWIVLWKNETVPLSFSIHRNQLKRGYKVEHKTSNDYTPRRKHWGNLLAIGLCNEFLGFTLKAKVAPAKTKWDHIKFQRKEHQQNQMAIYRLTEDISKSYTSKGLNIQKYMKHTTQGQKPPNNPNFKWSIRTVRVSINLKIRL